MYFIFYLLPVADSVHLSNWSEDQIKFTFFPLGLQLIKEGKICVAVYIFIFKKVTLVLV